jgi:hypothetical protein
MFSYLEYQALERAEALRADARRALRACRH